MFSFIDLNQVEVTLSFETNTFSIPATHVLVLANREEQVVTYKTST